MTVSRFLFFCITAWLCQGLTISNLGATELEALTENLPPLNYEQDGKAAGFSSELLSLIATDSGIQISKTVLPWARAMMLVGDQANALIYSLVRTPEREAKFQWVGPIAKRTIYLYKMAERRDITLRSLDDARKYKIGTTHESAATKNLLAQGFERNKQLEIAMNDETNLKMFMAGRFDLLLSLDWALAYNAQRTGISIADFEPALLVDDASTYWYGVSLKTDPVIVARLNDSLSKIKKDGRYTELVRRYLPTSRGKNSPER